MLKKELVEKVAELQEKNDVLCGQILLLGEKIINVTESNAMAINRILSDLDRRLIIIERAKGLNTDDLRQTLSDAMQEFLK